MQQSSVREARPVNSGGGGRGRDPRVRTVVLFVSGLVALAIGGSLLLVPETFNQANGVELGGDAGALSDARGAGAGLVPVGALILLGAFLPRLAPVAAALGGGVYLAYGLGRLLSMGLDGVPPNGLVVAAGFELIFGAACAAVYVRHRSPGSP